MFNIFSFLTFTFIILFGRAFRNGYVDGSNQAKMKLHDTWIKRNFTEFEAKIIFNDFTVANKSIILFLFIYYMYVYTCICNGNTSNSRQTSGKNNREKKY